MSVIIGRDSVGNSVQFEAATSEPDSRVVSFVEGKINGGGGGGGGGGNTITLTADTNIAAGTAVAINSSGHAVQTWGPAPVLSSVVTAFFNGGGNWGLLKLDADHFVAILSSESAGVSGAVAGAISGETISLGTFLQDDAFEGAVPSQNVWDSTGLTIGNSAALGSAAFVVAYNDQNNNNYATVRAGTISGGVITMGAGVQIDTNSSGDRIAIVALSATSFVLGYVQNSLVELVAGSVSGTTVALGTPEASLASIYAPTLTKMSASEALIIFGDASNSNLLSAAVIGVSGTTLTVHAPTSLSSAPPSTQWPPQAMFDSGHWIVPWQDDQGPGNVIAAGSISGTTTAWGAPVVVSPFINSVPFVAVLDTTHAAVGLGNGSAATQTFTLSGVALAGGTVQRPVQADAGSATVAGVVGLSNIAVVSSTEYFVADLVSNIYEATATNVSNLIRHYGTLVYQFAPVDGTQVLAIFNDVASGATELRLVKWQPINSSPIGFVSAGVSASDGATIFLSGNISGFSGLTPGAQYFVNGDGTLTTTDTGWAAAIATSSTTIVSQGIRGPN